MTCIEGFGARASVEPDGFGETDLDASAIAVSRYGWLSAGSVAVRVGAKTVLQVADNNVALRVLHWLVSGDGLRALQEDLDWPENVADRFDRAVRNLPVDTALHHAPKRLGTERFEACRHRCASDQLYLLLYQRAPLFHDVFASQRPVQEPCRRK